MFGSAVVERFQFLDDCIDYFGFTGRFRFQVQLVNLLLDDLLSFPRLMVQAMFPFKFSSRYEREVAIT
ncbi:hypothetical protein D9M70_650170 [compost metagenome]